MRPSLVLLLSALTVLSGCNRPRPPAVGERAATGPRTRTEAMAAGRAGGHLAGGTSPTAAPTTSHAPNAEMEAVAPCLLVLAGNGLLVECALDGCDPTPLAPLLTAATVALSPVAGERERWALSITRTEPPFAPEESATLLLAPTGEQAALALADSSRFACRVAASAALAGLPRIGVPLSGIAIRRNYSGPARRQ